ncbi:29369_t:CDS:1 [Gigaspora margarita]|uniref:29369_t:CDS:1 n=1 Tax=Gigaspora margarita TaxID=4874 RepID=A0ABN7V8R0_GIGMA|nr:29369_t:CDS:1 [Gigaspora margarita]
MSTIQLIDTTNIQATDNQIAQKENSMDLDGLSGHTVKKVKAILPEEIPATTSNESFFARNPLIQKDEKLELPKNPQGTSLPKKTTIPYTDFYGSDFSKIKFSYDNPYIAKTHMLDLMGI